MTTFKVEPDSFDDESVPASQRLSPEGAKAIIKKLAERGAAVAAPFRAKGLVNEAFVYGDQFPEEHQSAEQQIKDPGGMNSSLTPNIPVNLMAPLGSTWESLLTKDRPTAVARPASDEPQDVYDAQITQKAIEYEQRSLNSSEIIFDTVHLADLHGTAAIKITYDEDNDKMVWAPLSIFNFLVDPTSPEEPDDAGWVMFFDYNMHADDAKELLEGAGYDRDPTEDEHAQARAPAAPVQKGVEHVELWMKPTREFPEGLYICQVSGEVVEIGDYPLVIESRDGDPAHRQYPLPLVLMRVRKVRNCVYGNTNMTYVVPLQRAYNECVNKAQKLMRQVTNIHLVLPQELQENFDPATSTMIGVPDSMKDVGQPIGYTKAGEISPTIGAQRDFFEKSMQKVIGLNDVTANSDNPRLSGTAIENMVQLDAQRNADVTRSLQNMVLRAWELTLTLMGVYYSDELLEGATGGDALDVRGFRAEDLCGTAVRLELGSEVDTLQPAQERIQADRAQLGAAGPLDMAKAANSPAYSMSKQRAQQVVELVAAGQDPGVAADDIDPNVLEEVVRKAQSRAMSQGDRDTWTRLEEFIRAALAAAQARMGTAQPQPQGPPGGGNSGAAPPAPAPTPAPQPAA